MKLDKAYTLGERCTLRAKNDTYARPSERGTVRAKVNLAGAMVRPVDASSGWASPRVKPDRAACAAVASICTNNLCPFRFPLYFFRYRECA